jgi:hypothetical protein
MPDIIRQIEYDTAQKALVNAKLKDPKFSYLNWSDDDLLSLRGEIRKFYRNEQLGKCPYCKNPISIQSARNSDVEHIAPKSKYRDFIFEPKNLCVICADCNEIKRERETIGEIIDTVVNGDNRRQYPRTANAFKIVHPHFDNYEEHILILNNKYYLDKSLKGNFTIFACRLNRHLYAFGWEREIIDEAELFALMNKCLEETSTTKRTHLLMQLKHLLFLT